MEPVKFIHVSDLHLGKRQYNLKERYRDYFRAFQWVLDFAIKEKVDFILISGDLFDNKNINPSVLSEVFYSIRDFKERSIKNLEREIPLICIEGNHDNPIYTTNSWMSFLADLNLIILLSGEYEFSLRFTLGDDQPPQWLTAPVDFIVEAGQDFTHDFHIVDNTGIASFVVNDTTNFMTTTSGFLYNRNPLHVGDYGIEVIATDYYDNSVSAELTVMVRDTTGPTILDPVEYALIEAGTILNLNLTAYDFSGVDSYQVNDTRFTISESGILTSIGALAEGNYSIRVSVMDIYGNNETLDIEVVAYVTPAQNFIMTLLMTFGPITIVGIVIILIIRRRMSGASGPATPSYSIG